MQENKKKDSDDTGIHGFMLSWLYPSAVNLIVQKKTERKEGLCIPFIVTGRSDLSCTGDDF